MNKTQIEWVKNPDGNQGYTWNPITGCLNHDNGLCKGGGFPCYACKLANGRLKQRYLENRDILPIEYWEEDDKPYTDPFYPRFWEERLKQLEDRHTHNNRFSKAIGCFVCDMGDLFGISVPEEWTRRVLSVISKQMTYPAENDRFYLLTKQPQNLIKFSPFPDNAWVGVTCTNHRQFHDASHYLNRIKASVRFYSFEPLLGHIDYAWNIATPPPYFAGDWLIIGACTGTYSDMLALRDRGNHSKPSVKAYGKQFTLQPEIKWVQEIVEAADKAGIPVFLKDNLKPLFATHIIEDTTCLTYPQGALRQEMPNCPK